MLYVQLHKNDQNKRKKPPLIKKGTIQEKTPDKRVSLSLEI